MLARSSRLCVGNKWWQSGRQHWNGQIGSQLLLPSEGSQQHVLPTLRIWVSLTRRCSLCCAVGNQLCSATGALPHTDGFTQTPSTAIQGGVTWAGDTILSFLWMHSGENSPTLRQAQSLPGLCSCEQWAAPLSKAWAMQVQHPLGSAARVGVSACLSARVVFSFRVHKTFCYRFCLFPPAVAFQGAASVAYRTVNCSKSSAL